MAINLLKAASRFYKLSQDPLTPVRIAVESVLEKQFPKASAKTISVIGDEVKIAIHLESDAGVNRSTLQNILSEAVSKVDPSYKTTVTIDLSSEHNISAASIRKNFANFHKLSQVKCQPGDPMCDDLGAGLPPDQPSKPAPPQPPKPKPDVNKADDGSAQSAAQSTIIGALQKAGLGMRGFTWQSESKHILVEVGVPRNKKVSTEQINNFLTSKINSVAPGYTVITTLNTT